MGNDEDRITTMNPAAGKTGTAIKRTLYEPVRKAILDAIATSGEVEFRQLAREVERRTPAALWENAAVGWYTTTVKLDLEARGLIERVPGSRPQRLRLATGKPGSPTARARRR